VVPFDVRHNTVDRLAEKADVEKFPILLALEHLVSRVSGFLHNARVRVIERDAGPTLYN
jgi:hypothetical protein